MAIELQEASTKQSRRNWLRDAAIVTTSAAVMPSLLTSCTDHRITPGVGGPVEMTPAELELYRQAAENLIRMRLWYDNLYTITAPYILEVYAYFKGGKPPQRSWQQIIEDIAFSIAIKILEAAVADIPGASAAVGIAADEVKKWTTGSNTGKKVDNSIADFVEVYGKQHETVSNNLLLLSSSDNKYEKLREAFKGGPVDFNGKKYTLNDLAQNRFPAGDEPRDTKQYEQLRAAAVLQFKKNIWNTMFVLAGEMKVYNPSTFYEKFESGQNLPRTYAIGGHYPNHKATYLRGYYYHTIFGEYFYYASFYFTFDGEELSDSAVKILFKDDAPGNIINPDALFERDYVFKQFHANKPDFAEYYEIRRDLERGPCVDTGCRWFDPDANNYEFTKGDLGKK